jgi:hypothetical protein
MTEVNSGMPGALRYLDAADALIRKSLVWIKQQCVGGKGVSNEKLDEHQLASFDLAWCAAESTGARFALSTPEGGRRRSPAPASVWKSGWRWCFAPRRCRTSTIACGRGRRVSV